MKLWAVARIRVVAQVFAWARARTHTYMHTPTDLSHEQLRPHVTVHAFSLAEVMYRVMSRGPGAVHVPGGQVFSDRHENNVELYGSERTACATGVDIQMWPPTDRHQQTAMLEGPPPSLSIFKRLLSTRFLLSALVLGVTVLQPPRRIVVRKKHDTVNESQARGHTPRLTWGCYPC